MSDLHEDRIESAAVWLGEWLRLHILERWPAARVDYRGTATGGSRYWAIEGAGASGPLWLAATEPALMEPAVREIPVRLDDVDWRSALLDAYPDGVLISSGAQLFVWDRERDRGTRLIEPESNPWA